MNTGTKLIQAMKQVKDLQKKLSDLEGKVRQYCADYDFETPVYGSVTDQTDQISKWIQSHSDICKEILNLRLSIQYTNLVTQVSIELGGKTVTKSIAAWIHRRRDLAASEQRMWQCLTDKNLRDQKTTSTTGQIVEMKVRRYFSPSTKDSMVELYRSEPHVIDSTLEVVNATVDLLSAP